jgi:hypothetical protein
MHLKTSLLNRKGMQHSSLAQLSSDIEVLKEWIDADKDFQKGLNRLQRKSRSTYKKHLRDYYAKH